MQSAAVACCCVPESPRHVLRCGSSSQFQCCRLPASLPYPRGLLAGVWTEQNVSITLSASKTQAPHQQLLLLVSGEWFLMRRPQPVFTPLSITTWRVIWWAYPVSCHSECIQQWHHLLKNVNFRRAMLIVSMLLGLGSLMGLFWTWWSRVNEVSSTVIESFPLWLWHKIWTFLLSNDCLLRSYYSKKNLGSHSTGKDLFDKIIELAITNIGCTISENPEKMLVYLVMYSMYTKLTLISTFTWVLQVPWSLCHCS